MRYYIYRNQSGQITGYAQTSVVKPPPAIEVSKEEFQALGFYCPEPELMQPVTPPPTVEQLQAKITMLEAQNTFLENCILEMADEVYA